MATILSTFGEGGKNINPGAANGTPSLATALRDIADDLATTKTFCNSLRTAYNATLAKMDADAFGDTNYAATNPAPAAIGTLKTIKG